MSQQPQAPQTAPQTVPSNLPINPMQYTGEVSLDDDIKLNKLDKLKMKTGESVRVGFALCNEQGAPRLQQASVFFDDSTKKAFRATTNQELNTAVAKKLGKQPAIKFGTIVCMYNVDQYDQLLDASYELKAFVFSGSKFPQIKTIHKQFPLSQYDLIIRCEEAQYQNLSFSPANAKYLDQFPNKQQIIEEANLLFEETLPNIIGYNMPEDKIKELIFNSAPQPMAQQPMMQQPPMPNPHMLANQVGGANSDASSNNPVNPFGNIAQPPQPQTTEAPTQVVAEVVDDEDDIPF